MFVYSIFIKVSVLCPGYQDPHYLAAKPSLSRRLRKANLLLYNGLELEVGWLPLLIDAARNPGIRPGSRGELDCSQGVAELLQVPTGPVDRSQGDIHPLGNPHYLLDPRNGRDVGFLIAERLAELDPDGAQFYQDNATRLAATLDERAAAWQELAAPARGQVVMVYHQHWEYLLNWLGLGVLGAIEHRPGIAPSPKHVEQLILAARSQGRTVVLAAPWDHLDVSRRVAERTGSPLLVLPGAVGCTDEATDYLQLFDIICGQLGAAFSTP